MVIKEIEFWWSFSVVFCLVTLTVDSSLSSQLVNHHLSSSNYGHSVSGAVLSRAHRQVPEDSYEEYEYEDEVSPTEANVEEKEGESSVKKEEKEEDKVEASTNPDPNGEDGDEYYDPYDESPTTANNNPTGGNDEDAEKAEDEEEDTKNKKKEKSRPRTEHEDDDDEDSEEREDRIEEERRQAEIREQERLEEEKREEERREQQRRQEAAEEEEDNEEDLRREEEERIRTAAAAGKVEEEAVTEQTQHRHEEVEEENNQTIHENEEEATGPLSEVEKIEAPTTVVPEETEVVEYEDEVVEEGRTNSEFEEENQLVHENKEGQENTEDKEEFDESGQEYHPTESDERIKSQVPIAIEESGREDLERYSTVLKKPEEDGEKDEVDEDNDLESRKHLEENKKYDDFEDIESARQPGTGQTDDFEDVDRRQKEISVHQEEEEFENNGEEEEDDREEVTEIPTEDEVLISVPTTRQTPSQHVSMPTQEVYKNEHEQDSNENKIDQSSIEEELSTTFEPNQVEENERGDRLNQNHRETISPTEHSINSLDVDRTHQGSGLLVEEDEEDDDQGGFYEGRRFNEENRRNNMIEEDEDEGNEHAVENVEKSKAANLDLSREPDEREETDDGILEETTTSRPTTYVVDLPQVNEIENPDTFENRIDDVEDDKITSLYDNKFDQSGHHHHRHQHGSSHIEDNSDHRTPGRHLHPHHESENENNRIDETPSKIECFSGYYLSDDGTECLDVDECLQNVCGPTQICLNTPGSFRCTCKQGFAKDFRNELLCRDINECEIGNGGCSKDCINIQGSYYCSCSREYQLSQDGRNCVLKQTTTTTSTTTTTTTTTPAPTTVATTTSLPVPTRPTFPLLTPTAPLSIITDDGTRVSNCPTPPVPRGSGIAYLYCSRSPVGIHHRHSQLEKRLLQDWAARKNRYNTSERVNSRFRLRRNLKRLRRRQQRQTAYSPGSMCELRCRAGFELKGQYTLHCNSSTGLWQGTTEGYCQAASKSDNKAVGIGVSSSEATPSNEIPRFGAKNEVTEVESFGHDRRPFKPSFRPSSPDTSIPGWSTSFRPNFYQLPPPTTTSSRPLVFTPPPPATRLNPNSHYWTDVKHSRTTMSPKTLSTTTRIPTTMTTTTTTTIRPYYNYYSPVTPFKPIVIPFTTTSLPFTTTRNSFIHLTYKYTTPWITCPDDVKIDLQPGQRLAYVIIPQPQTNVDWWRQVTAEPAWAKGLEVEIGPGKQKVTFGARTTAPLNNSAECSFVLEVRDIEPPTIRDCPESFSIRLSPGQSARAVSWVEPHFSDNVRISAIKKSREPGTIMAIGEHVVNYEVNDSSNNRAKCSFTVKVQPTPVTDSRFNHQNNLYRKPFGTEGITTSTSTSTPVKPDLHTTMRNVVCHVGKKGRRIVFQSRVVPRGCSEMALDLAGDSAVNGQNGGGSFNTLNTLVQNSAENSATSQISSVSYSSNDHPQSASAFGQAISNGRNSNRLVHSTSVVTNGAQGTSSRASSYALSSSRNFDTPLLVTDKQVYDEDFVVPTSIGPRTRIANSWSDLENTKNYNQQQQQEPLDFVRSGGNSHLRSQTDRFSDSELKSTNSHSNHNNRSSSNTHKKTRDPNQQEQPLEYRKYFRHFDSWDVAGQRQ